MAISNQELQAVRSQDSITLAVSTAGSDTPSANRPFKITKGDYSAYPFATPQAAFNALPKRINHTLTVNIGAGSFPAFAIEDFTFAVNPTINGTRALFTPATGPNTGFPTFGPPPAGGSAQIVVTGAGWTPNDLVGKFLVIVAGSAAGTIVPIWKNTTDTIYVSYNNWYMSDSEFRIEEITTIINTALPSPTNAMVFLSNQPNDHVVYIYNIKCSGPTGSSYSGFGVRQGGLITYYCQTDATIGHGIYFNKATIGAAYYCSVLNTNFGFRWNQMSSAGSGGCMAKNCVYYGIYGYAITGQFYHDVVYLIGCGWGLYLRDVLQCQVGSWGLIIQDCNIGVEAWRSWLEFSHCGIDNCVSKTFVLNNSKIERTTGWLYGSGNAGWGMNVSGFGNSFVDRAASPFTAPTLTGTLGEATVDGITPILWTDLDGFGDYAVDEATGARIVKG